MPSTGAIKHFIYTYVKLVCPFKVLYTKYKLGRFRSD